MYDKYHKFDWIISDVQFYFVEYLFIVLSTLLIA